MDVELNLGILSLIPLAVTIFLALFTKNVILSLFVGVLSGVIFIVGGNPISAFTTVVKDVFVVQLMDSYNAAVIVLLVFIGGFIALMEKSGGAMAFAKKVAHILSTRCKVQIAAWIGGIIIFFSDLGTPLIVGPIFEPLFDKFRISREKLAYIIDVTAAPVAVLVPFIGWGAYIMGLIQKEFTTLNLGISEWDMLVKSIPYNIYSIISVLIVPVIAWKGYELGAMAKAEKRSLSGKQYWENSKPMRTPDEKLSEYSGNSSGLLIGLPIVVLLVTMVGILIPLGFPMKAVPGGSFRAALSTGYIFASIVLIILMLRYKVRKFGECIDIYTKGMSRMMSVCVILVLAWSLGQVSDVMGTAKFIVASTVDVIPAWALPVIAFIFGSILSFATSSSWGTWALLFPIFIPLAHAIGCPMHIVIGGLLGGGIFGGHPTPVSDQAILASMGAGCDHLDHIKTQLPVIMINGAVSLVAYVIAGITGSIVAVPIAMALSIVCVVIASRVAGTKIPNYSISDIEKIEKGEISA